ncbi:MAG TPA: phosphoribosylamine--glycine ligase [Chloroflexota bacterium]|nr:phosphoribosylamine--glycine ligase [Chloroflexota bacterium]
MTPVGIGPAMKILVVGGGAREHALVWKLAQSPRRPELYCAPGNAGTAALAQNVPIGAEDVPALAAWADEHRINLTIVGPEAPLVAGLADALAARGRAVFGPTQAAAQIEASKAWAKDLMQRHGIPTARCVVAADREAARRALDGFGLPVVVKADGLAAGKGVTVAQTRAEAEAAIDACLVERAFGAAGERVLIEECLTGRELSVLAFADGQTIVPMVPACDYKRVGDGDTGPNTGGMGAYAPPAMATPALMARVQQEILGPTLAALAAEGRPYRGVLYAGLMLTADGPKVLEFNCRFGDPETQVVLPLLDSDLVEVAEAVAQGRLDEITVRWRDAACCGVVLAAGGYPGSYATGQPITGLDKVPTDVLVFHAGTKAAPPSLPNAGGERVGVPSPSSLRAAPPNNNGGEPRAGIVTAGGRVLTVAAVAPTLAAARERAYAGVQAIHFEGAHYRRDVAARELVMPAMAGGADGGTPLVGIIMGSESDRQVMQSCADTLAALGVPHEMLVMSAHRTPERVGEYGRSAAARGLRVIIAGAGMAAHLPGVLASWTTLPVIGVPLAAGELRGLDALYAIVQMPPGVPVATVGIGSAGARNAAYLAAAIVGQADAGVRERYEAFRRQQSQGGGTPASSSSPSASQQGG